jgi:molybdopterin converting factor subunit 1
MKVNDLTVKVKLFAIYQEVYQQDEIELKLPLNSTVKDVLAIIIDQNPQLSNWQSVTKLAVNLDLVSPQFILNDGDEVALIPPVSGGKINNYREYRS